MEDKKEETICKKSHDIFCFVLQPDGVLACLQNQKQNKSSNFENQPYGLLKTKELGVHKVLYRIPGLYCKIQFTPPAESVRR